MLKCSCWKIPLVLLIGLFLITGCSAINNFLQEDMRGPSWDTSYSIPLINNAEFTMAQLLSEDPSSDPILLFSEELEKMEFTFDDLFAELDDLEFDYVGEINYGVKGDTEDYVEIEYSLRLDQLVVEEYLKSANLESGEIVLKFIGLGNECDISEPTITITYNETKEEISGTFDEIDTITFDLQNLFLDFEDGTMEFTARLKCVDGDGTLDFNLTFTNLSIWEVEIASSKVEEELELDEKIKAELDEFKEELDEHLEGLTLADDSLILTLEFATNTEILPTLKIQALDVDENQIDNYEKDLVLDGETQLGDLFNLFPHYIRIFMENLGLADSFTINRQSLVSLEGKIEGTLQLKIGADGITNKVEGEAMEFDQDLGDWINSAKLNFEATNQLPMGIEVAIYFCAVEADMLNEDNSVKVGTLGLPGTEPREGDNPVEPVTESYYVEASEEVLEMLINTAYFWLEIHIPNPTEDELTASFRYDDKFKIKTWLDLEATINPREND